jgi:hypothetical protein
MQPQSGWTAVSDDRATRVFIELKEFLQIIGDKVRVKGAGLRRRSKWEMAGLDS